MVNVLWAERKTTIFIRSAVVHCNDTNVVASMVIKGQGPGLVNVLWVNTHTPFFDCAHLPY